MLKPTVRIEHPTGEEVPDDVERHLKISILGWQHNSKFNEALESWRSRLLADDNFEFPSNCGSPFKFRVKRTPILARIMSPDRNRKIQVQTKFEPLITHAGVELKEPNLVFSNQAGTATDCDPHPVRGIVQNRPFDYALTARNLKPPIQLAVICPARESRKLSDYLQRLHQSTRPGKFEADYLLPFDGFQNAFATPMHVPSPGENLWMACPRLTPPSTSNGAHCN